MNALLSIDKLPAARRAGAWRDAVCSTFVKLECCPDRHAAMHGRIEASRSCRVIVHIGGNAHTAGTRGFDGRDDAIEFAPVGAPAKLQVIDLRRAAGGARDANRLIECDFNLVALASHMC